MQNSCTLLGFSPWLLEDGSCPWGWGHLSPIQDRAIGPSGLAGCSSTQWSAALPPSVIYSFPNISIFMCKAGKSRRGLSYLQALEKQLLDFKTGLNTYLFHFLNFPADAVKEPNPPVSLQVTALQSWIQSHWAVMGDLSLRCHRTFHKLHCILHCYFTTQSQSAFWTESVIFSANKLPFTTCSFFLAKLMGLRHNLQAPPTCTFLWVNQVALNTFTFSSMK